LDRRDNQREVRGLEGEPSGAAAADQGLTSVRGAATAFTDILSISGARAASIALALVSMMLVTHLLRPGQYSILAYISVISGLIFTSTASWTSTAVTRYGREELESTGVIRATSWSRLTITAPVLAVALIVVMLLKLVGALPAELHWGYVAIASASGISLIAAEHVLNLLEASGRMKLTAVGLVLQRVVSIAGIVILVLWGVAHSPAAIALIWLASGSLFAVALGKAVWRSGMWPPGIDRALLRRMVIFSLPMIAFAVSQYVIGAVDIVILGVYRPPRDVGLYAIAYQGYGVLLQVATTATIVLSPLFVSLRAASREGVIQRFYERLVPQVLLLTSVGAGLAAPLLTLVVPVVFGRPFAPAAAPFALLLIAWILYTAASFVAPILVLHERSRAIGVINVVAAIVNVTVDWVLIGVLHVGVIGPAIATGAALAVIAIGYFHAAADAIDRRFALPVAMVLPGFVGIGAALSVAGLVGVVVGVAGTLIAAVIVLVALRPLTAEDADLIEKLNIPGPCRGLALRLVARLG
jgi:O-antigen/teichoic acid export membrane protein